MTYSSSKSSSHGQLGNLSSVSLDAVERLQSDRASWGGIGQGRKSRIVEEECIRLRLSVPPGVPGGLFVSAARVGASQIDALIRQRNRPIRVAETLIIEFESLQMRSEAYVGEHSASRFERLAGRLTVKRS